MKTRPSSSSRKRCVSEVSSRDEIDRNDSAILIDSNDSGILRSHNVRISTHQSLQLSRQQKEESQLRQVQTELQCADSPMQKCIKEKNGSVSSPTTSTKLMHLQLPANDAVNPEKFQYENDYSSKAMEQNFAHVTPSKTAETIPIRLFPSRTSAYLQSLAEICHAVLWDVRWRVGGSQQLSLIAWEHGDDMNAIHQLSRRYIQINMTQKQQNQYGNNHDNNDKVNDMNMDDLLSDDSNNKVNESQESEVECDPDDRCLEIYSRLYFRKGPWFRLDNIYKSYYLPKKHQATRLPSKPTDASIGKDSLVPPTKKLVSPSKFFRPRNTNSHQNESKGMRETTTNYQSKRIASDDDYIDQGFVDLQLQSVSLLLRDIKRLISMGLIRSFLNEEECGKTVGRPREKFSFTAMSLLRLDEQSTVLRLLGGGQKQNKGISSRTTPTSNHNQQQPSENLIWKQMCQQQTIFRSFKNGMTKTVLPVMAHVNKTLMEKWASLIILEAKKVEYIPPSIYRSFTKKIYNFLSELTSELGIKSTIMCIRLREAPVRTLRRACRLYLCATSGPGDMRNNGTNAWRSLPEIHTKDLRNIPLRTNIVPPPGSSWNTVCYPGRDWRLRVFTYSFIRAYEAKPVMESGSHHDTIAEETLMIQEDKSSNKFVSRPIVTSKTDISDDQNDIQVFFNVEAFHQWEIGVQLRENCDYLLELNELLLYDERKRARETKLDYESEANGDGEGCEDGSGDTNHSSSEDSETPMAETKVDFLDLLTIAGRAKIIRGLLPVQKDECKTLVSEIERHVSLLLEIPFGDRPLSALMDTGLSQCNEKSRLDNECERILGVIGIILIHVLEFRNASISEAELTRMMKRRWLRHMYWEGCMSYVLWDIIPILERRGYYMFAISALEVLLFGRRLSRTTSKLLPDTFVGELKNKQEDFLHLYQPLISRRARGKALDRLIIDYTHLIRKNGNETDPSISQHTQKLSRPKKKKTTSSTVSEMVNLVTEPLLRAGVVTGQITFSSIRTLARRLKRPLSLTLQGLQPFEAIQLGHRLSNSDDEEQDLTKYKDWSPITDTAVANAMTNDRNSIGGRCSFIGFEEDDIASSMSSLNVEELAKEYYHQGRLPASAGTSTKGGWIGYHDEGGKIRILFRILSSATLGMDWNYGANSSSVCSEALTVHLTPYQGAPFDLHVGAEHTEFLGVKCRGIYARRKCIIENFLGELSKLDGEDLSTFVYDCMNKRVQYTNSLHRQDLMLESDLRQARSLSMIAVGFGGKMLASIFRCLFFDYRHYSGGLPDLLLVRAMYTSTTGYQSEELVDLGEWVGEEFSSEHQESIRAKQIARTFMDTDGDFLGCSKVGDSGGRATNRFHRSSNTQNFRRVNNNIVKTEEPSNEEKQIPYSMPEKLYLSHDSRRIRVECMFVEVKSQNDRLDSRQEDWLNILDKHGNARVCKFTKNPKRAKGIHNQKAKNS